MLNAKVLEVTGYFTAFDDGGYNRHLSLTMLTLSHIDFKDFSQHFAPTRVFDGTLVRTVTFDGLAFLFLWL
jgi:hypothetical protein